MKKQQLFPGIILIGFGGYFFFQPFHIKGLEPFFTWPTLMLMIGIAFLFQGYVAKDYSAILPGVILTGFGLHFHIVNKLAIWPDHIGIFILILALGLLLQHQKTGAGLFQGLLFLILSIMMLFYEQINEWLGILGTGVATFWTYWPIALILIGLYFLFIKKNR